MYPALIRFAVGDKNLCPAEAETLYGTDQNFLPTMIGSADGIVAALGHPMDILAPKSGLPEARHPRAMYPDFVG